MPPLLRTNLVQEPGSSKPSALCTGQARNQGERRAGGKGAFEVGRSTPTYKTQQARFNISKAFLNGPASCNTSGLPGFHSSLTACSHSKNHSHRCLLTSLYARSSTNARSHRKAQETCWHFASLLGARMLLGARTLLGAPGIATRSKDDTGKDSQSIGLLC